MICECGREHEDTIKQISIGAAAMEDLRNFVRAGRFQSILTVVDLNTKELGVYSIQKMLGSEVCAAFVYPTNNLIPDEKAVEELTAQAIGKDLIIAVGSGTINDLSRHVSFILGIPYIVFCTAPSMDGYASNVSPLIINGMKTTVEAHTPEMIAGDLEVLKNAPPEMITAGFGDLFGKYSCLADWRMGNLFFNEYYCERIAGMAERSLNNVVDNIEKIAFNDIRSVEILQNSLILSGVAMSYAGNSRPASGAEHHISHFWEMVFMRQNRKPVLHGIKVGVATLVIFRFYDYLRSENICPDSENYRKKWDLFLADIERIPTYAQGVGLLKTVGHPVSPVELGIDREMFHDSLLLAKQLRPRFTILCLLDDLGLLEKYAQRATEEIYS